MENIWVVCGKRASGKTHYAIKQLEKSLPPDVYIVVLCPLKRNGRRLWKTVRKPCCIGTPNAKVIEWLFHSNFQVPISIVFDEYYTGKSILPNNLNTADIFKYLFKNDNTTKFQGPKLTFITQGIRKITQDVPFPFALILTSAVYNPKDIPEGTKVTDYRIDYKVGVSNENHHVFLAGIENSEFFEGFHHHVLENEDENESPKKSDKGGEFRVFGLTFAPNLPFSCTYCENLSCSQFVVQGEKICMDCSSNNN